MKPKLHFYDLFILAIIILPFLYLAYKYPQLPAVVPTHFGLNGKPDATGDKSSLWQILGISGVVSILLFLLMRFLPKIDPKKSAKYSAPVFNKIAVAVVLLLCAINFIIILAAENGSFNTGNTMTVMSGVFFAFMGNIMHSIKPNYFAGIRTPWTLENEETWRKTHQLGGKIWFAGGIVIAAGGLVLSSAAATVLLITAILIMTLVPVIYSYTYFKSLQTKS